MSKDEVIKHISAEIQTTIEATITSRTRFAFFAWTGPFVLLGALFAATKGDFQFPITDPLFILAMATACGCYLGMGYAVARIEHLAWMRCDLLRDKLMAYAQRADLSGLDTGDLAHPRLMKDTVRVYMILFVLMCASFLAVGLASSRTVLKTPRSAEETPALTETAPKATPAASKPAPAPQPTASPTRPGQAAASVSDAVPIQTAAPAPSPATTNRPVDGGKAAAAR